MNTATVLAPFAAFRPVATLLARERRLAIYGFVLLALLLPMAVAAALDGRTLRGVDVWIKPMKFALSIALLALTTAWFAGHLPNPVRNARAMDRIVWLLIGAGTFEFGYIALQAALGEASHYNVHDPLHAAMYAAMGVGALLLNATQPMLAWQLWRHPDPRQPAVLRLAIVVGLVLTFVFGAGIGAVLASIQPPAGGPTMPLLGWALGGGDLRPAHFVGIHAEQVLPLAGLAATRLHPPSARAAFWLATLAYAGLFAFLVAGGLSRPA